MNQLSPYLRFTGKCREALTFYQACFGGDLKWMTVAETPLAAQMSADVQHYIMHATLTTDRFVLLGSDMAGPGGYTPGNTISLFVQCSSEAETRTLFAKLSPGGKIADPLKAQFWGGLFGAVTDQYGIEWRLSYEKPSG
jgi:PhnB protein